jgi:hypothetical protein
LASLFISAVNSSSFFGSTFNKLVSLTVVFGADLNFDFSAKSGRAIGITAGLDSTGASAFFSVEASAT